MTDAEATEIISQHSHILSPVTCVAIDCLNTPWCAYWTGCVSICLCCESVCDAGSSPK